MQMRINKLLVILAFSMLFNNAVAADFNKGLKAAQSGDFKTALAEWTPLAEQGYADAQSNLGTMYDNGSGVLTDTKRAYMWYNLGSYNSNELGGENKDNLAKEMTPADLSKAQEMSIRCLESNYTDC
jgi:hypothetical protein